MADPRPGLDSASGGLGRPFRELPSLLWTALHLLWAASPRRALLTLGLQAAASVALLLQLLLISDVLDAVLAADREDTSVGPAVVPVVLLATVSAGSAVISVVAVLQEGLLGELVSREVWRRILDVSQSVELSVYDDPEFYDQAERVQRSAVSQTQTMVHALLTFVGDALGVAAATVALLSLAPALTPILLISGLPLFAVSRVISRREFAFSVEHSASHRERRYLQSVLAQREEAKEVRAFALAGALRIRWENNFASFLGALRRHLNRRTRLTVAGHAVAAVLTAVALILTIALVDRGDLSIASAGAALVAVRLLGSRVGDATSRIGTMFESSFFLRDLDDFINRSIPSSDQRSSTPAPPSFDRLTVEEVSFTYPQAAQPALVDVSIEIKRGEVIALVGENGSGKSTFAKILANLYEPVAGSVRWDGVDIKSFDAASVRERTAVIFQDFVRYKLTARENISLGRPNEEVDADEVREAARSAGADAFLTRLPAGYETPLSKEYVGGSDLSLGQWQRVALARAFIRDAPFVILDEPSASLDARAEHELFERTRTLFAGRTVLLISHRFSTVRTADRIFVLSAGRVVEHGDHSSLMEQGGLYAELFGLQANAYLPGHPQSSSEIALDPNTG